MVAEGVHVVAEKASEVERKFFELLATERHSPRFTELFYEVDALLGQELAREHGEAPADLQKASA